MNNQNSFPLIEIQTIIENEEFLPKYATDQSAGADIRAHLKNTVIISPGKSALIPTGIRVAIPDGFEIQVRPRSGLALKNQITVLNTPGTVDADYRGEICVILINHGTEDFTVTDGMRIAQLILAPVFQAAFIPCLELATTKRGVGGFGHTGQN